MKNFLIILMFGMFTCLTASARDVGTQLQADVGTTVLQMQQPVFTADLLTAATFELAPAVQCSCTQPSETKVSISPVSSEAILWIDPGLNKLQVSVTNSLFKQYNYSISMYYQTCNNIRYGFTHKNIPTARHVFFIS